MKFTNKFDWHYDINSDENDTKLILKNNKFYSEIYQDLIESHGLDYIIQPHVLNVKHIVDTVSISFEDPSLNRGYIGNNRSIDIELTGDNGGIPGFFKYREDTSKFTMKPIESIDAFKKFKCFTFFDEKQIQFSKNLVDLENLVIAVKFAPSWFPFNSKIGILMAIHSPKTIPDRSIFNTLEQNSVYNIYHSKLEDIRLNNYDNCIDRGDNENYNFTRNYCIDKCYINSINPECLQKFTLSRQHLVRSDQLPSSKMRNIFKSCYLKKIKEYVTRLCNIICLEDCNQTHYFIDIKEQHNLIDPDHLRTFNEEIQITMQSHSRPNIILEHFAEMTLLSLICDFGGLIGMYLGISIQSVSCDVWDIMKKIISKFKLMKIFNYKINNNNNLVINNNYSNIIKIINTVEPKYLYTFHR